MNYKQNLCVDMYTWSDWGVRPNATLLVISYNQLDQVKNNKGVNRVANPGQIPGLSWRESG